MCARVYTLLLASACAVVVTSASHAAASFTSNPALPVHSDAAFDCSGTPNTKAIWTQDPVFVRSVPNGALYQVGNATQNLSVVHLYGTAYQLG